MDKEVVERALKAKLTAGEWKVLAAMTQGYLDIYDIQRVTGLQKVRVEAAVQNARTVLHTGDIYISSLPLGSTVQNARTPPEAVLFYLYRQLGMTLPARWVSELSILKELYVLAYEKSGRKQSSALLAIKDCIDVYQPELLAAGVPVKYFAVVFKGYLRGLPPKSKDRREYEQFSGTSSRWNPKTKAWEKR